VSFRMEPEESKSLVFRFSDPRQQRIYEELKEVMGPGPAAFFHDTCWLMANPEILDTTAHLVAHLLRELESTIRNVFKPVVEGTLSGPNNSRSHKEEIKSILATLNIEEGAPEAKAWFELADQLHCLAHRRRLEPPRPPREISELWYQSQTLLSVLLESMRKHFLTWVTALDDLLSKSQPTKADLKRLTQEIPNNLVTRRYFFDHLESHEWLEPLQARGVFRKPPQSERNEEEGTIRFSPWPEGRYLARMARHKPELVAKIIQEMNGTDNAAVISDLVDALLAMPPNVSARFVKKAAQWAESPYLLLPKKLGQLIAHLAKGGKTEEAMTIARVLLDIQAEPRQQQVAEHDESYRFPPKPKARFDTLYYKQILKEYYPDLVREAGLPALNLLCELLEKAIDLSRRHDNNQGDEDYSRFWCPVVEDHPQSFGDTTEAAFVVAVRDAAELLVRSKRAAVEEVVRALESRYWKVFRRIALHVLRAFPDQAKTLAAARLTDRSLFNDMGLRHEYVLLLREHFPRLTPEDQAKVLGWIEDGPEVDQRDWLARIGPENLPAEWHDCYSKLVEKYGEPEHPKIQMCMWVGPASPKTADELKVMSVTEIVKFLKTWKPPENIWREPSPEGLGRVLASVVTEDPARFAAEAPAFQDLDPTYVRALFSGLRDALKKDRVFDWEPVLDLCNWVLSQPREVPGRQVRETNADPDWGWTRRAIAELLSIGFENHRNAIPIGLRQRVWAILKPLTDDPDPTPEHEQRYGGSNMDPATLSINTTRGEAMHTVIRYALWVRRHLEKEPGTEERLKRGFNEMPEVREVLEAHLNPARDPSLAIRAVYGEWFTWLVLLDPEWTKTHAATIFPQDQESETFFEAAWNTYVTFCRPYDNVWEILRPYYRMAVDRIDIRRYDTRWLADPDEKLSEHLMVFYWCGNLSLDDPLFTAFWGKAPDAVRAHALTFVGRLLEQTEGKIESEILNRLMQLLETRFAAAKEAQQPSEFEKEIAAFGWWFASAKFEVEWSLKQLYRALKLVRKTKPAHIVLERLEDTAKTEPLLSVKCLMLIVEGDREGWEIDSNREHVRAILQQGLQDPSAKQEAEGAINYLGSRGFVNFRDLLQG